MSGPLYKFYTNGRFSSNLTQMLTPTGQYAEPILPLYQLCQGHWWGYESHSAIVLVKWKQLIMSFVHFVSLGLLINQVLIF